MYIESSNACSSQLSEAPLPLGITCLPGACVLILSEEAWHILASSTGSLVLLLTCHDDEDEKMKMNLALALVDTGVLAFGSHITLPD